MALGSTRPLREMSTRSISREQNGRYVRLTTLPPSWDIVTKYGSRNFLEPSGTNLTLPTKRHYDTIRHLLTKYEELQYGLMRIKVEHTPHSVLSACSESVDL